MTGSYCGGETDKVAFLQHVLEEKSRAEVVLAAEAELGSPGDWAQEAGTRAGVGIGSSEDGDGEPEVGFAAANGEVEPGVLRAKQVGLGG